MTENIGIIASEIERFVKFGTKNITESEILNRAFQIKPITIIPQGQGAGLILPVTGKYSWKIRKNFIYFSIISMT